jgi:adenosylcobinamide kinase/adenosylcobinamide-phosphate guanylyltransferase
VATGVATDPEMADRIARHRAERPPAWRTLEARYNLKTEIEGALADERTVLVEDLGTLVTNLLVERDADDAAVEGEVNGLIGLPPGRGVRLLVVSNEVGWGLVPTTPLGRRFADLLGRLNQRLAAQADEVVVVVAGLPLRLKP